MDLQSRVVEFFKKQDRDITGICQDVKLDLVRAKIAGELNPSLKLVDLRAVIDRRPRSVTVEMLQEYLDFVKKYGERR